MRRLMMTVLLALACAVSPLAGAPSASAASSPDRLVITVRPTPGERVTWALTCHPTGGSHPNARRACRTLDRIPDALVVKPNNLMCTQIWSGPERARVTGTWDGRRVDMSFARNEGCATATWNQYGAVLIYPRDTIITGSVDLGPTCPVEQVGQDCTMHGAPATVTATSQGRTLATTAGDDGFRLRLPSGIWQLTADAGMHCDSVRVIARPGMRPAPIVIACDTGIR
ncbi:MAG: hypothetical protein GC156_16405 [Actinomycetales bacterium]|nr:hypothetical protein [Actinomycetales bacterium]